MNQQQIDDLKMDIDQIGPDTHAYALVTLDKNGNAKTKFLGNLVQVGYLNSMMNHHFSKVAEMSSAQNESHDD